MEESQMGVGIRRSQRDYTLAFKLAVVDEVEQGALTYREAQHKYGIQGRSTVLKWLRKHGRMDWHKLTSLNLKRDGTMVKRALPMTPEQKIKALEMELKETKLKAELFEAMLELIRTEYGVKLPKKPLRTSSGRGKLPD
jgi:transposase-like protein